MESIKILIADDNITATDNLTKLHQFENDFEVVGQVHRVRKESEATKHGLRMSF
jgi:DNA-binding NarL/FixJ family response regulator